MLYSKIMKEMVIMLTKRKESLDNSVSSGVNLVLNIFFILYSAICTLPLLLVLAVSFSTEKDIVLGGYRLIPETFTFEAYKAIFEGSNKIFNAYATTIIVTIVGVVVGVFITAMTAYPLSRKNLKYRNKISFYLYFTSLFNGGLVPWYLVYTQLLPLRNTILALIIPNMIGAFNIIIMRTYFNNNIHDSLIESARIDGASETRTFFTIVLPLATPVLATIGLFTSLGYWNDFFRPLIFISEDKFINLQYLLYKIQSNIEFINTNPEYFGKVHVPSETARMAMVIMAVGPIVFVYPFLQRYFIKGLTIGSVKG